MYLRRAMGQAHSQGRILIIDDEPSLRQLLDRLLRLEGFEVLQADSLKQARAVLGREKPEVVLCDVRLPDGSGLSFLPELRKTLPLAEIIVLTAHGNIADGVQAMKSGAFDYLTKGNDNDRILPLLHQACGRVKEKRRASVQVDLHQTQVLPILGKSPKFSQAVSLAAKIAPTDTTVLLSGETGTGKEVFARFIYQQSKRSSQPFIAINCSAFTHELLESELFGHKAGAFTGAFKDKKGLWELADKGTLFLDEIGELDLELQAKLLRALETGEFIKLGDTQVSRSDVRILAATNRHLETEVERGRFRQDLFYRIDVFGIELPPLRERPEDIPELARHFLAQFSRRESAAGPAQVCPEAMKLLKAHGWPGNIRELRNVLERAFILQEDGQIRPAHLPYEFQSRQSPFPQLSLAQVERAHIAKMLAYTGGNKTRAANLLQIGLSTLYRKLEEYGLSDEPTS